MSTTGQPARISGVSIVLDVVVDLVLALRHIEDKRALSAREAAQLDAFEAVREGLCLALPAAFDAARLRESHLPLLFTLFMNAEKASAAAIPIIELLGMRGAVPQGRRWRFNAETLGWLGTARLVDDARLICTVGEATPERQNQLAALRDLQAAFSALIERSGATDDKFDRANARVKACTATTLRIIGDQATAIRAEAAVIRARRQ